MIAAKVGLFFFGDGMMWMNQQSNVVDFSG